MEKKRKKASRANVILQGIGLSLGIYLLGISALALLAIRGAVGEAVLFPAAAVLCFASSLAGAARGARALPWGRLLSAAVAAGCFAALLPLVGLCIWGEIALNGRGAVLMLCALTGGAAAGLTGGRRKPKRKRK